jgi:Bacterial protein of unknown function (DUF839)
MLRLCLKHLCGVVSCRAITYSHLLMLSGVMRLVTKESLMKKLKTSLSKRAVTATKVVLVAGLLAWPTLPVLAADDFGSNIEDLLRAKSLYWFGVDGPLAASAPSTTGAYRKTSQAASDQVFVADSLNVEYLSRNIAHNADQFAFWPTDEKPTHQIWCIEEFTPSVLKNAAGMELFLPGDKVKKWTPGVQRLDLSTGAVETILRGTAGCDGIRRTPWGTILATEEDDTGGAYEIIDPLHVTNHTIINRALGTVVEPSGLPSSNVVKRTALGKFAWEGIAILPSGVLYAGDELRPGEPLSGAGNGPDGDGGAIFKFVPANPRTTRPYRNCQNRRSWPVTSMPCRSPVQQVSNTARGVKSVLLRGCQ